MAYAEIKQESMERDIHHRESNSGEQWIIGQDLCELNYPISSSSSFSRDRLLNWYSLLLLICSSEEGINTLRNDYSRLHHNIITEGGGGGGENRWDVGAQIVRKKETKKEGKKERNKERRMDR